MAAFQAFLNNRWMVFVGSIWTQSSAGAGYVFGSMSPVIKGTLGYNQRQIGALGVAKDLGQFTGFFSGTVCATLPFWAAQLIGALKNLVGYGWVWLIVSGRLPALPLWGMCILIFVGTNGGTYFNTTTMVSCLESFPKNRGPVVGIVEGFAGLSGAILTQIYTLIHTTDLASIILMVAIGPSMLGIALMFIIKPVGGHGQAQSYDDSSFVFVYIWSLILAAYLTGVILVQDLLNLKDGLIDLFTVVLLVLLVVPIVIPLLFTFYFDVKSPSRGSLLSANHHEIIFGEVDDKPEEIDLLSSSESSESKERIPDFQTKDFVAEVVGGACLKREGPRIGEDFTFIQALMNGDFWLLFTSFMLGTGSGLMVIDNLGQLGESLGYEDTQIFVSMMSVWNFLGRIAGGYLSEIIVREKTYPRPMALAVAQAVAAIGHFFIAMAWPGTMYIGTFLIGIPFGAHCAIVPAIASEMFGLKHFGAFYNFLAVASPAGSMIFSGVIASTIYDYEAEKQAQIRHRPRSLLPEPFYETKLLIEEPLKCEGAICFFLSSLIMVGVCMLAVISSIVLVYRTKTLYTSLYARART